MLGTGSKANDSIRPAGFIDGIPIKKGGHGHARGHLIARQLGGDGNDPRNIVTLYQDRVNNSLMRPQENKIANKVRWGEKVFMAVTPMYFDDGMPHSIRMSAYGDRGFKLNVNIINSVTGEVFDYE